MVYRMGGEGKIEKGTVHRSMTLKRREIEKGWMVKITKSGGGDLIL